MTRKITLAVAALLCSGVLAQYKNAPIDFRSDLDCTSCIRGGYNYCVTLGSDKNNTIVSQDCENADRPNNNFNITIKTGGVADGYLCSRALKDEMNAIIGACRPYEFQNTNDDCGSYLIDLTQANNFTVGRNIIDLPLNSSCTYRAVSTCGYPQVSYRINNQTFAEDFDIAWATKDGVDRYDELDRWEFNETTDYRGSFASNQTIEYTTYRQPNITEKISAQQWSKCQGVARNLWVTFTRVKDSDPSLTATTARQLQFYPNGTKTFDLDVTFSNWKQVDAASLLKVVYFAVVAGLAVLAF